MTIPQWISSTTLSLTSALSEARAQTGQRIDVLGMDACPMSMFEVAYQVRDQATYLVGSQEIEPGVGWPYDMVLRGLGQNPDMSPADLGRHIVRAYGQSLAGASRGSTRAITQSAIDLKALDNLAPRCQNTGSQSKRDQQTKDIHLDSALLRGGQGTVRYYDKDYVDLSDFLSLVRQRYGGSDADLLKALDDTLAVLGGSVPPPVIIENYAAGPSPYERSRRAVHLLAVQRLFRILRQARLSDARLGRLHLRLNQISDEQRHLK